VIEFFSHEIVEPDAEVLQWVAALGHQSGQFMSGNHPAGLQHEQFLLKTLMEPAGPITSRNCRGRFLRNSAAHCNGSDWTRRTRSGKLILIFSPTNTRAQAFEE